MRSQEAYTPGPWTIVEYGDGDSLVIHHSDLERICFMATPGDSPGAFQRIQANARAIAALPDLVAAVREALGVLDLAENYGLYEPGSLGDADVKDCREQLRRAHHAATGAWATPMELELGASEDLISAAYAPAGGR